MEPSRSTPLEPGEPSGLPLVNPPFPPGHIPAGLGVMFCKMRRPPPPPPPAPWGWLQCVRKVLKNSGGGRREEEGGGGGGGGKGGRGKGGRGGRGYDEAEPVSPPFPPEQVTVSEAGLWLRTIAVPPAPVQVRVTSLRVKGGAAVPPPPPPLWKEELPAASAPSTWTWPGLINEPTST